jgi:hypothetical protein
MANCDLAFSETMKMRRVNLTPSTLIMRTEAINLPGMPRLVAHNSLPPFTPRKRFARKDSCMNATVSLQENYHGTFIHLAKYKLVTGI